MITLPENRQPVVEAWITASDSQMSVFVVVGIQSPMHFGPFSAVDFPGELDLVQ